MQAGEEPKREDLIDVQPWGIPAEKEDGLEILLFSFIFYCFITKNININTVSTSY